MLLLILIVQTTIHGIAGGQNADYILIEDPSRFRIYDRYEQSVTFDMQREYFPPGTPGRIISEQTTLSDAYTTAMKIEVRGAPYYIPDADPKDRGITHITGAEILEDTLVVSASGGLDGTHISGTGFHLAGGELFIILFRTSGRYYVRTISGSIRYGWLNTDPYEPGNTDQLRKEQPHLPESGWDLRIRYRIDDVNGTLERLFRFFNGRTEQSLPVPKWTITRAGDIMKIELIPERFRTRFAESARILAQDIANMLPEKNFRVRLEDSMIVISPR